VEKPEQTSRIHPETGEYEWPLRLPLGSTVFSVDYKSRVDGRYIIAAHFHSFESAKAAAISGRSHGYRGTRVIRSKVIGLAESYEEEVDIETISIHVFNI
jgi:hypothetical protein